MKAVCWIGRRDVQVERVPDPEILRRTDAIVRVTAASICGSDVQLWDERIPTMREGDVLGHEFMGEVVEVGPDVRKLRKGARVVVPFPIACGACGPCRRARFALCENSNPNAALQERLYGQSTAGIFGHSHLFGGYAGGLADFVRVPFADVGPVPVPEALSDEQALFVSDVLPAGLAAAARTRPGDVVAVWGAGPVGLFAIACASLLGASRVAVIDRVPERLKLAVDVLGATAIDVSERGVDVTGRLRELSAGRGPDVCIDAVGMGAHGTAIEELYDRTRHAMRLETDRTHALAQAIQACARGGTVSVAGVYAGFGSDLPIGAAFAKGLSFEMGYAHVQAHARTLLERILHGELDPTFVVSHRLPLAEAPRAYELLASGGERCVKVVLRP